MKLNKYFFITLHPQFQRGSFRYCKI